MVNLEKLPRTILEAVRQNWGVEPDDPKYDDKISNQTPLQIFDSYLIWHGIIGYAGQIADALDSIRAAKE